jgi:tRNA (adenine22-N1)-methyltransferase
MELKGRLRLIASKVPECDILCDVGTDHAYIPIYLAEKGICKRAVASDVRKGPIEVAAENIRQAGLEHVIQPRMGYGLDTLDEKESDVIVIAGMGGTLITEILQKGLSKAKKASCLVLQPMKLPELVREWLYENGFNIEDEDLICEEGKIYNIIVARWTGLKRSCERVYLLVGEKLVEKKDPLLLRLITKNISVLDKVIRGQKMSENCKTEMLRNVEMREALKKLLDLLKE